MTLATRLTIARLVMAPAFVYFLAKQTATSLWIASILFLLAAATDTADGYLARRTNTVTKAGRILDPLADKVLVGLAYVTFLFMGIHMVKGWMVAAVLGREFLVTGFRQFAGRRGVVIHSSQFGKWKTTLQMALIFVLLLVMTVRSRQDPSPAYWKRPGGDLSDALYVGLIVMTLVTLLSGLDYLWKNRALLRGGARS
jgi:CDP-diacylglycerol--glycerol-3-phosphate 3-phosphatidyltransferase